MKSSKTNSTKKLGIRNLIFLLILLFSAFNLSAQSGCIDSTLIGSSPICPTVYMPVCGCNGITYGNECIAQNDGVIAFTEGACGGTSACIDSTLIGSSPICPTVYLPVCGCNGITYGNECIAQNDGVIAFTQGACSGTSGCVDSSLIDFTVLCTADYAPVCGCDGVTYSNICFATNYGGVTSWTTGECGGGQCIDSSQIDLNYPCNFIYSPVCGCNFVTYSNECEATYYAGVTSWTSGECIVQFADSCTDLAGIDFGPCDMFMGYGLINGICSPISGCGPIVNGINYSQAIVASENECELLCGGLQNSEPCDDLAGVDFGICTMYMGIGIINGQCVGISGCGWEVDGIDYTPSSYPTMDSCQACLTNQIDEIPSFDLTIFPNPTNGKINVQVFESTTGTISVLDLSGRILITNPIEGKLTELNLSDLSPGTYFVKVDDGKSAVVRKIIKN